MKQKLIPSSINHYMVGFVPSLHMQSDLNPKKKVYLFSGGGVFFVPDCISKVTGFLLDPFSENFIKLTRNFT